jgi:hypothetical protein
MLQVRSGRSQLRFLHSDSAVSQKWPVAKLQIAANDGAQTSLSKKAGKKEASPAGLAYESLIGEDA